jgi:DNA-binding transcriptional regulator LsrR (DeoR family)
MVERTGNGQARGVVGPTVDLLMELATRFYVKGETQIEIARSAGLDPSTVSRYLKRARDDGIVHVQIRRPRSLHDELARELAGAFSLRRAVVVADDIEGDAYAGVARAAADYVNSQLANGMRLGLSWGRMLSAAIHAMPSGTVTELDISLLHGGVGSTGAGIQGHELARYLASLHPGSRVHYLNAPLLVDSPDIKDAMVRDGSIKAALDAVAGIELALVGIGALDESAPLIRYGHIPSRDRDGLLTAGAVGDIATRFFTPEGEPDRVLDDRLLAIEWEQLKQVPLVVAMASGPYKRDAILGALRTGSVDVLVTDEPTAREVLRGAGQH